MNMDFKEKQNSFNIKGRVEIFNEKGEKILDTTNMIMDRTRLAALYGLFRDNKILATGYSNGYFKRSKNSNYVPVICGFMFGDNGENKSSPPTLRVPDPTRTFDITQNPSVSNTEDFHPIKFLSLTQSKSDSLVIGSGGSLDALDDYINNVQVDTNKIKDSKNIIKYFYNKDNNYYCKAIDLNNCDLKINNNSEFEYIINFKVEPIDLIGANFSEIGLVIASCNISNNIIQDIDDSTVMLASRLTFSPISLSSQLLASFNVKYHIYI